MPEQTPTDLALCPVASAIEVVDPDCDPRYIADALGRLDDVAEWVKRAKADLKERMLAWVIQNGDLVIGVKRYYAGIESETKCVDVVATLRAFLETLDVDTLALCLSASAFKPGETRKNLAPELFEKLFSTEQKTRLKDGKPLKGQLSLIEADDRFIR